MKKLEVLLVILIGLLLAQMGITYYLIHNLIRSKGQQVQVSSSVSPLPELVKRVEPEYPLDLREKGIEGNVILKVLVDTSGRVAEVQIARSSGYGGFDSSAVEAAKKFQFKPATTPEGEKVPSWIILPFSFKLK